MMINTEKFQADLLAWYDKHKKPLPWRLSRDPYKIWISEIMSQQTQVETVIPYYERFIKKYPTIKDLAEAEDAELLKLWEGLGYYSRARNLKLAAIEVQENFDGVFPSDLMDILSLKGIGPYTAAAIASIAFDAVEPAIDGNLLRVTSRLYRISEDISLGRSRKVFEEKLRGLISSERPGDFNQALMDIGSTICKPKQANCDSCPLADYCQLAFSEEAVNFPVKTKKLKQKDLYYAALALQNSSGEYYLEKRPSTGLLANMWTFPLVEMNKKEYEAVLSGEAIQSLPDLPESISRTAFLDKLTHIFSHQKWHIAVIQAIPEDRFEVAEDFLTEDKLWLEDMSAIPLAGPQVKIFELLNK
ncbi:A/G-specific adenine glycosylase [Lactococcus termiticola]|uniref:Adenine DNA glycosylase n=1 Tax=Lactococcus termiticola TaxID=2169526 RepID=A0A2R5HEC6_9LACT|nr:A/G-specific adenine glycosylase [Lactococcus termiticola]GBG96372.1 A/G-specific adenine glycosylase [Lactococcus termiticola]